MRLVLLSLALLGLLAWKAERADWIVECEYSSADFHPPVSTERYTATYSPSVSPIWNVPSPEKITGRLGATWSDSEFFAAGGSYGPTSAPRLRFNWQLSGVKIVGALIIFVFVIAKVPNLKTSR